MLQTSFTATSECSTATTKLTQEIIDSINTRITDTGVRLYDLLCWAELISVKAVRNHDGVSDTQRIPLAPSYHWLVRSDDPIHRQSSPHRRE